MKRITAHRGNPFFSSLKFLTEIPSLKFSRWSSIQTRCFFLTTQSQYASFVSISQSGAAESEDYEILDDPQEGQTTIAAAAQKNSSAVDQKLESGDHEVLSALVRRTSKMRNEIQALKSTLGEIEERSQSEVHRGKDDRDAVEPLKERDVSQLTSRLVQVESSVEKLNSTMEELQKKIVSVSAALVAKESTTPQPEGEGGGNSDAANSIVPPPGKLLVDEAYLRDVLSRIQVLESKAFLGAKPMEKALESATALHPDSTSVQQPLSMRVDALSGHPRLVFTRVEVCNLSPLSSASGVRAHMESAGPVVSCFARKKKSILTNKKNSPSSLQQDSNMERTMIVTFTTAHDAVRAIENLDKTMLNKQMISVRPFMDQDVEAVLSSPLPSK